MQLIVTKIPCSEVPSSENMQGINLFDTKKTLQKALV